MLQQRNGGITNFVDIIVASNKLQRCPLFIDFHDLTSKLAFPSNLLQVQFTISTLSQTGQIIQSTHPERILTVAIDHCGTSEFRCMDNAPLGTVVIEQSIKVTHEHRTVLSNLNVEVDVVASILCRRIVPDQGKTLRKRGEK